jgi:hypothetical protein
LGISFAGVKFYNFGPTDQKLWGNETFGRILDKGGQLGASAGTNQQ